MSTQMLTSGYCVADITETILPDDERHYWKLKVFGKINEEGNIRSDVFRDLLEWQRKHPIEFKKLHRAIRYAITNQNHDNPKLIKQDENGREIFEFRNCKCKLRLLFFYDEENSQIIVCTNSFQKGNKLKAQRKAFDKCQSLKDLYLGSNK